VPVCVRNMFVTVFGRPPRWLKLVIHGLSAEVRGRAGASRRIARAWARCLDAGVIGFLIFLSLLSDKVSSERPGAVKGAPMVTETGKLIRAPEAFFRSHASLPNHLSASSEALHPEDCHPAPVCFGQHVLLKTPECGIEAVERHLDGVEGRPSMLLRPRRIHAKPSKPVPAPMSDCEAGSGADPVNITLSMPSTRSKARSDAKVPAERALNGIPPMRQKRRAGTLRTDPSKFHRQFVKLLSHNIINIWAAGCNPGRIRRAKVFVLSGAQTASCLQTLRDDHSQK
jgi:hypothetical protein